MDCQTPKRVIPSQASTQKAGTKNISKTTKKFIQSVETKFYKNSNYIRMSASLNEACMAGNVEEVLMRLNMGEDVNQKLFPRYTTALHDATTCGRVKIVQILIER